MIKRFIRRVLGLPSETLQRVPRETHGLGRDAISPSAAKVCTALREAGFGVEPIAKLGAAPDEEIGERPILEAIAGGDVRLVVNTPTPRSGAVRDAADIRHAAIAEGVLCLTAIETGIAAAEALDPEIEDQIAHVRPITEWVPSSAAPVRA